MAATYDYSTRKITRNFHFVMCKHPDKEDDKDSGKAQRLYNAILEEEALAAL